MIRYKIKDLMQKKALQEKKITYKDVALATGISEVTLSRLANNKHNATGDVIEKICKYFNCKFDDLMEIIDS